MYIYRNIVPMSLLGYTLSGGPGNGHRNGQKALMADSYLGVFDSMFQVDVDFGNFEGCRVYNSGGYDMA